jgi:hypothetical protein
VGDRVKKCYDRPRDKIPITGQRYGQNGLEIKVRIPVVRLARTHIQHVIILLKSDGPKVTYRVREFLIDFGQGYLWLAPRGRSKQNHYQARHGQNQFRPQPCLFDLHSLHSFN